MAGIELSIKTLLRNVICIQLYAFSKLQKHVTLNEKVTLVS